MKYLPFEKYTVSTTLSVEQVQQRLLDNLEPDRNPNYIMHNTTKPFTGRIDSEGFTINRVIRYRNSFLPDIKGRFISGMGHTEIHIVMRPTLLVLGFMGVWMTGILIACAATLADLQDQLRAKSFSPIEWVPFGILLFGYGLCMVAFKAESKKAKQFLMELWGYS